MLRFSFSRNQEIALLAIVGLALLGLSYGRIRGSRPSQIDTPSVTVSEPGNHPGVEISAPTGKVGFARDEPPSIVVHVAGRVKNPSVYSLKPGCRVADAIHMAGGPASDANLDSINLAAKVQDGQQILVPSKKETTPLSISSAGAIPITSRRAKAAPSVTPGQTMVNINTAGLDELDALPGVGPATAQKIIDYRGQIGRFSSIEQLEEVKGIGPKKLDKMRPFVCL